MILHRTKTDLFNYLNPSKYYNSIQNKISTFETSDEDLLLSLDELELKIEKEINNILTKIDIQSSTKSNRKSLPYTNELKTTRYYTSYIPDIFNINHFYREIVKFLINNDVGKIRFYIDIKMVNTTNKDNKYDCTEYHNGLEYNFKFYIHNDR